ncbi:pyroglutamyl-peptidase I family protein, partial [Xanthobacter sediminis]
MAGRPRILICAFGPFPGVPVNPSERLGRTLAHMRRPALAGCDLALEILPTRWAALGLLERHLDRHAPDAVLLLGVAPRRRALCVETRAVNVAADR